MAGGCAWQGGMHGGGACIAGGHAWHGGVRGKGMCGRGHAWWAGVHGGGHAWQGGACMVIRLMSERYASYWNAFLFK